MKSKSLIVFIIVLTLILILILTACTTTLASVNGYKISQKEIDKYLSSIKVQNPDLFKPENKGDLLKTEAQIIDYIIANKLIEKYANENKISFAEKEFDEQYSNLQTTSFKTKEEFDKYLKDNGISEDLLKIQLKNQLLANKVFEKVTQGIAVTDAEVQKYYDDNKNDLFLEPEQLGISHILVKYGDQDTARKTKESALEKIKMVQKKISEGETFENMANKYSEDENSNTKSGDIGYFSKGQLIKEFEDVAFSLKVGEISDIVETPYGFHLIKVTDKKDERIKTFDEVKDSIKQYLESNLKNDKFNKFLLSLKDAAVIKYSKDIEEINKSASTTTEQNTTETINSQSTSTTTGSETQTNTETSSSQSSTTTTEEKLITPDSN
ncbi:MAG: peptidylprolyl isomerase [Actinobacteria bacterium]|nr:peptidylprolyl isomerase [Actinomycetota bacterium]